MCRYKAFAACVLLAASTLPADVQARTVYPYCAVSRGHEMTYEDCSFRTFELCLEEIKGLRGFCQPNRHYVQPPQVPQTSGQHRRGRGRG
jgi:hypothetical protein